jgi:hypothetical protein
MQTTPDKKSEKSVCLSKKRKIRKERPSRTPRALDMVANVRAHLLRSIFFLFSRTTVRRSLTIESAVGVERAESEEEFLTIFFSCDVIF